MFGHMHAFELQTATVKDNSVQVQTCWTFLLIHCTNVRNQSSGSRNPQHQRNACPLLPFSNRSLHDEGLALATLTAITSTNIKEILPTSGRPLIVNLLRLVPSIPAQEVKSTGMLPDLPTESPALSTHVANNDRRVPAHLLRHTLVDSALLLDAQRRGLVVLRRASRFFLKASELARPSVGVSLMASTPAW